MRSPSNHLLFNGRLPAPAAGAKAEIAGFEGVRLTIEQAEESLSAAADRLSLPRSATGDEPFNILAISGGAAGGAFGAGVLVGLTKARARPTFAIVTGVSTGALMAPFAFLGPDWDARLTDAYTGGYAAKVLSLRRLAPAFGEADGRLDPVLAKEHRESCRFAHQAPGVTRRGALVHGPGGRWQLHYDTGPDAADEIAFRLDEEQLRAGEYVSVMRKDGDHPYRVTAVGPV